MLGGVKWLLRHGSKGLLSLVRENVPPTIFARNLRILIGYIY